MTDHPITPPPELIEDWIEIAKPEPWKRPPDPNVLCTLAAQWGADQELEACCEWTAAYRGLEHAPLLIELLRAARRPPSPSLKEQALIVLDDASLDAAHENILRRALEQLDD